VVRAESDPKFPFDDLGNPTGRPTIASEPIGDASAAKQEGEKGPCVRVDLRGTSPSRQFHVECAQQAAGVVPVIVDPELSFDDLRESAGRPYVTGKSVGCRSAPNEPGEAGDGVRIHPRRTPGPGRPPEGFLAPGLVLRPPDRDGRTGDPELSGDLTRALSAISQLADRF
jgi:hypothetical protein